MHSGQEEILDHSSLPEDFSLKELIKQRLYADNIIVCKGNPSRLVKEAIAVIFLDILLHEFFKSEELLPPLQKTR